MAVPEFTSQKMSFSKLCLPTHYNVLLDPQKLNRLQWFSESLFPLKNCFYESSRQELDLMIP